MQNKVKEDWDTEEGHRGSFALRRRIKTETATALIRCSAVSSVTLSGVAMLCCTGDDSLSANQDGAPYIHQLSHHLTAKTQTDVNSVEQSRK